MAAAHAVGLQAQHLGLDDVRAVQQHQPMHRAGEAVGVAAPAHRLGNRHRRDRLAQDLGQQGRGARARRGGAVHEALALGIGGALQRGPVDPGLGGEALQRLGRLTLGIQRDVQVRAQHFAVLFRLLNSHAGQQHGQAARGRQRLGIATFDGHATLGQAVDDAIEEGLGQARQRLDRQFFGTQFNQQRLHRAHACTSLAATASRRLASYSLATAWASARTRRM